MHTEIGDGIYSIGQWQGGQVRCFLLDDGRHLTLVDTLWDTDAHRVLEAIQSIGRKVTDLHHIVITHAHFSHLGGLAALQRMSNATVHCHIWEADIVEGDRAAQPVTFAPMRPVHQYFSVYYLQYGSTLGFGRHRPYRVNSLLGDGDRVGPLQVINAAGHTPGHLAFYWPERKALFAGDAVVSYPVVAPGWPAFVLNHRQAFASLCRMADRALDLVAVGHGDALVGNVGGRMAQLILQAQRDWGESARLEEVAP